MSTSAPKTRYSRGKFKGRVRFTDDEVRRGASRIRRSRLTWELVVDAWSKLPPEIEQAIALLMRGPPLVILKARFFHCIELYRESGRHALSGAAIPA